jgi:hypothetical protein
VERLDGAQLQGRLGLAALHPLSGDGGKGVMNRTIKFRGRWKKGNRQWYYGTSDTAAVDYKKNIIPLSLFWADVEMGFIDPATVGEWSGRTDCNGSDIYCGDKVSIRYNSLNYLYRTVTRENETYTLEPDSAAEETEFLGNYESFELHVIGTIYDNPAPEGSLA